MAQINQELCKTACPFHRGWTLDCELQNRFDFAEAIRFWHLINIAACDYNQHLLSVGAVCGGGDTFAQINWRGMMKGSCSQLWAP